MTDEQEGLLHVWHAFSACLGFAVNLYTKKTNFGSKVSFSAVAVSLSDRAVAARGFARRRRKSLDLRPYVSNAFDT